MYHKILNLPLPYYRPDDGNGTGDEKSDAQKQRDNIKVTSNVPPAKEQDNENNVDENNEGEEEENEEEKGEKEENEEEAEDEKEEAVELTAEQKQIKALERKIERLQKRVGHTVGERDAIKKELKEAKDALTVKLEEGQQPLTEDEVNRRAKVLADQELTAREFNKAQEKLIKDATALDKNFMSKINSLAEEVAPLPAFFIGALDDLDNGGAVLNYLTENADEYEDLLKVGMNRPIKAMKGLVEISNKLIEASKPKPKKISQVPEPPKAPKGGSGTPDVIPPKPTENMKEFVRVRNLQDQQKRKERMGG